MTAGGGRNCREALEPLPDSELAFEHARQGSDDVTSPRGGILEQLDELDGVDAQALSNSVALSAAGDGPLAVAQRPVRVDCGADDRVDSSRPRSGAPSVGADEQHNDAAERRAFSRGRDPPTGRLEPSCAADPARWSPEPTSSSTRSCAAAASGANLLARLRASNPPLELPPLRRHPEDVIGWARRFRRRGVRTSGLPSSSRRGPRSASSSIRGWRTCASCAAWSGSLAGGARTSRSRPTSCPSGSARTARRSAVTRSSDGQSPSLRPGSPPATESTRPSSRSRRQDAAPAHPPARNRARRKLYRLCERAEHRHRAPSRPWQGRLTRCQRPRSQALHRCGKDADCFAPGALRRRSLGAQRLITLTRSGACRRQHRRDNRDCHQHERRHRHRQCARHLDAREISSGQTRQHEPEGRAREDARRSHECPSAITLLSSRLGSDPRASRMPNSASASLQKMPARPRRPPLQSPTPLPRIRRTPAN